MNTFTYIKLIIKDELDAFRELLVEQRWLILALLTVFAGLIYYLNPFPPRALSIAAGDKNGAYWKTAEHYADYFRQNGVQLTLVESAGSIENAQRLAENGNSVEAAFIQGGSIAPEQQSDIYSLGSVAYEPLWIFYRADLLDPPKNLTDLTRYRVGIGPELGGTQKLVRELLLLNGIPAQSLGGFILGPYAQNLEDFQSGKLDILIKVAAPHDQGVQTLVSDSTARLLSIPEAIAYQKNLPYIYALTVPANSLDIERKIPKESLTVIATTSSIVTQKDLHPDLQMLFLLAARDNQRASQHLFFAKRGEFPAYVDPTIPASPVALHYYDYGVPPGMRYLPFWLAGFINRMWVLILSILAFTYPIGKLNLKLREIRYHIKHRRLYEELLGTELYLCEHNPDHSELVRISDHLQHLNREAINVRVPVGSEADYFVLLQAIELLRAKIRERISCQ